MLIMNVFVASFTSILILNAFNIPWPSFPHATAWSFPLLNHKLTQQVPRSHAKKPSWNRDPNPLFATSNSPYTDLSSAYDKDLPPSLVGEAVRSALRSNRGICFDFSTNRYGGQSRLVSVVKIRGKGTKSFLNAKFSQSVPRRINGDSESTQKLQLIRSGVAYETAYLTSKGRIIDRLLVLAFLSETEDDDDEAFLITSPGNSGSNLYDLLAPLVFPMDRVVLTDCSGSNGDGSHLSVITLACSKLVNAQTSFNNNIVGLLNDENLAFDFPAKGLCNHYQTKGSDIYILEHTFLSTDACHGYTLVIEGDGSLSNQIWNHLTAEQNNEGPVGVGSLEYETLRIEAAIPGYGFEMSGDGPKLKKEDVDSRDELAEGESYYSKANPLELHLQHLIDIEKGCYQGQEGVASMMKNARGSPRILYQVVFYDSENDFDGDSSSGGFLMSIDTDKLREFQQLKEQSSVSNDTRQPQPGDSLFVLGSNESILVGTITSVAQPNGTGEATTVALALVRRSDSILKSIKEQGLEMPRWWETPDADDDDDDDTNDGGVESIYAKISRDKGTSGIMNPPPLDPLVNLEVVIGGTYTIGRLCSVPSRRYQTANNGNVATLLDYEGRGEVIPTSPEENAFIEPEIKVVSDGKEDNRKVIDVTIGKDDPIFNDIAEAEKEAAEAAAQAEKAAAEAKRKAEKMEMLKAKAEAAMAARRNKKK